MTGGPQLGMSWSYASSAADMQWHLRRTCLGCAAIGATIVLLAVALAVWLLNSREDETPRFNTPPDAGHDR